MAHGFMVYTETAAVSCGTSHASAVHTSPEAHHHNGKVLVTSTPFFLLFLFLFLFFAALVLISLAWCTSKHKVHYTGKVLSRLPFLVSLFTAGTRCDIKVLVDWAQNTKLFTYLQLGKLRTLPAPNRP